MKFSKIVFSLTAICVMLMVSVNVFACRNVIEFENFESYGNKISGVWKAQGRETTAPIVKTDRGYAVKQVSEATKMLEVFQDFARTSDEETSFLFVFSAKYGGADCSRGLYTRNDTREYPLMYVDTDLDRIRLGNQHHKIELKNDVWYDFQVEYNAVTGYTRCTVFSEGVETVIDGTQSFSQIYGLWRVNFPAFTTVEGESETYITNVGVYALDYDIKPFVQYEPKGERFENFNSSSDGLSAPDGWSLQNTSVGSTSLSCMEVDGSPYGKSLVMYWDGKVSKVFELLRENLGFGNKATIILDLMRDEGSATNLQIRGSTDADRYISYASVAYIDAEGTVKVGNKPVCSMSPSKWYKFRFDFDSDTGTYYLTVNDGDTNYVSLETAIPRNIVSIDVFGFRYISDSMAETRFYIDNCIFEGGVSEVADVQISGFKTGLKDISPLDSSVEFALNGDYDSSVIDTGNIAATLNGSSEGIAGIRVSGNLLIVDFEEPFEAGKMYMVEITGNLGLGISRVFICKDSLELAEFAYSKSAVEPGILQCSVKMASYTQEYENCFVLCVLRDKSDNSVKQTSWQTLELSAELGEAVLTLDVPSDGEYVAETFIWKSVYDMQSLFPSKVLR